MEGSDGSSNGISREHLNGTALREAIVLRAGFATICSEEELDLSRTATLSSVPGDQDIWVFGYGSLVWNPIFPVTERRRATVFGFHRAFCLESTLGRGTSARPGLMLALDLGGACAGVVLKMGSSGRDDELRLLWRREMLMRSYRAVWVRAHCDGEVITALTFVANRHASNYIGRLPVDDSAVRIAAAAGLLGTNLDYLIRTHAGLAAHGIEDPYLRRLLDLCRSTFEASNTTS